MIDLGDHDPLAFMLPGDAEEQAERRRLARAGSWASAQIGNVPDGMANALWWHVADTATVWTFRAADIDRLKTIRLICQHLAKAALLAWSVEKDECAQGERSNDKQTGGI